MKPRRIFTRVTAACITCAVIYANDDSAESNTVSQDANTPGTVTEGKDAIELLGNILEDTEKELGADHPQLLKILGALADLCRTREE